MKPQLMLIGLAMMALAGCGGKQTTYEFDFGINDSTTYDSDVVTDTMTTEMVAKSETEPETSTTNSTSSRHNYDDDDDCSQSSLNKHSGTAPDDDMFGFDYYDDVDDAYDVERNQYDAYPDEKDW